MRTPPPSFLFPTRWPAGRWRRGCVAFGSGLKWHSVCRGRYRFFSRTSSFPPSRLTLHSARHSDVSPPRVCSPQLLAAADPWFISFASSARFAVSALSSEAIYPPSTSARANPANGCRNQRSASKGYGRFRAYPCVDERVFVAFALSETFGFGCGSRYTSCFFKIQYAASAKCRATATTAF
jgi:hypothetical protein